MAKVAFLGLGQMGTPMATRLVDAGHELIVWNRTREKADPLAERGAAVASSPSEAAAGAEFVITMLATPEALEEVLFGADGAAAAFEPGQILIDMSTVGPDMVRDAAARLPERVSLVDAPVRGSTSEAAEGSLIIFVGASEDDHERVRPLLESLGQVHRIGPPGSAAAMKVVVNATLAASIVALGEALALGASLGLDRATLFDVLADSAIGSSAKSKRPNVESGHYPPRFKLRLAVKDLRLAVDAATNAGLDLKQAEAALAWLKEGVERGSGDLDYGAVVATISGDEARA
jgi:3-hydroxyisobutyrate dehydrogenase-like beta-hydroxyacid dehydrogenase